MTRKEAKTWLDRLYMKADITDEYGDMEDTQPYEEAIDMAIKALEQEPCEIIKEIPKDYKYDTETEDFLVYRHMYTGREIHIEKPVPRYRLEQEPFINKPCVSEKACEYDKNVILDKIREIVDEWQSDTWTDNISYECMVKIAELVVPKESEG